MSLEKVSEMLKKQRRVLGDIAEEEDLNGRVRGNILDTQRAINFLLRCRILTSGQIDDARQILQNIESLNSHTSFLFDKINFLMDATIGCNRCLGSSRQMLHKRFILYTSF